MPAVHRTKQLSNSREELAGGGPAHPTGGRRQGERKAANSAPETAPPTKRQTVFQLLTKDFLRFWMVDISREKPEISFPEQTQGALDRRVWKLRLGPRGG